MYNIEVDGTFTYFVGDVWVHNNSCPYKGGGRYGDVRSNNIGGEVNHIPPRAVSKHLYSRHKGPSIWMEKADHIQTNSWGRSATAQAHRKRQAELIEQGDIRGAIQMDIDDIRSKFGSKYDANIGQMLDEFGF